MKILYTTTVGLTMIFFKSIISELIQEGHTVDIACNESEYPVDDFYREHGCRVFQIGWTRMPFTKDNIRAVKSLRALMEQNDYDMVHCHTPVAGVCTRLACKKLRKDGLRVFYTAHGFHFYKGAPRVNWLVYYPIEKYCARFTDVLITINKEDYAFAQRKMHVKRIEYVPGVGIDVAKFQNTVVDRREKRKDLGIPEDAILLLSVGELNSNKNQQVIIKALKILNDPRIHYAIVGDGFIRKRLIALSRSLGVDDHVHFLGYRHDVNEIMKCADIFVHPSYREGLSVSVMEAMASGLTITGSDIRGVCDLVPPSLLAKENTEAEYARIIRQIIEKDVSVDPAAYHAEDYAFDKINETMKRIYSAS